MPVVVWFVSISIEGCTGGIYFLKLGRGECRNDFEFDVGLYLVFNVVRDATDLSPAPRCPPPRFLAARAAAPFLACFELKRECDH